MKRRPDRFRLFCACFLILISIITISNSRNVHAQSASDIQQKIDQKNADIKNLEKEIKEYQKQIDVLGAQASSLSATIKTLDLTKKKLETDIQVTENKISAKNLEIQQLGTQITGKENDISDDRRIVTKSFTAMNENESQSIIEMLLGSHSFSQTWNDFELLGNLQTNLYDRIHDLNRSKTALEANKTASEKAKGELTKLNTQLRDQRQVVLTTVAEKNSLLKDTKQSESSYKKTLATKQALKDAFEQEVINFESQLRLTVDASKLPSTGSKVLSYPVDSVYVTQYFGNTPFATANSQIYNGKGHTGIDLRASIGTPIKAALSGVIAGVGDTDLVPGCYSYGRWVMIKHPDGLSTLYAHLSVPKVETGQQVVTGEIIGYSGNTGYTTGPHLHFGVYATQGVQIQRFENSKNCKGALIPIADFKAYLNPMSFL